MEEDLGADIGATRVYSSGSVKKPGHTLVVGSCRYHGIYPFSLSFFSCFSSFVKFNRIPAKKSWPPAKGF